MEAEFWFEKWEKAEIGFHQDTVHGLLVRHWPVLGAGSGGRVFVPLCGKSLDMVFLLQQGCEVVGCELSPIAIRQFFAEQSLEDSATVVGGMPVHAAEGIRLIEGDFFRLTVEQAGAVDAVYDRAALIAMPPALQERYAAQLLALTPVTAPMLLITLDYDPAEMSGPPFATPAGQVRRLFGERYAVRLLEEVDALAANPALQSRGLSALTETAWHLWPR